MSNAYAENMFTVADADRIAQHGHAGQRYGADGDYYREHLLLVAEDARPFGDKAVIVALNHDLVEDTRDHPDPERRYTLDRLRALGMDEELVLDLDAITRRPGEPYMSEFIHRAANRPRARLIKLFDNGRNLAANETLALTDPARAHSLTEKRYKPARRILLAAEAADTTLDRPRILN